MHASAPMPAGGAGWQLMPPAGTQPGPACADTCITCGDVAVAVRVIELLPKALALVDTASGPEQVSVALVTARVGDVILVHAGEALAVLPDNDTPGGGDPATPPARI